MAIFRRHYDVAQAFRNDPQLQQFLLNDITSTGRILGTGSYGSVVEVTYRKLVCAGKSLHEALLNVENEGVDQIVQKYLKECQLMSSLRHPNITQFLGLCFLPEIQLPLLVMERLETSLDDLLEHMSNLPFSLKCSVLGDVASGLLYLHKMQPQVIHRDLTSNNVLLTSSLVAKITDMGNSRIVDLGPGQMAKTLTKYPGALDYMPPEALDERHRYGPSLDIFSFGHLALYTLTQTFPDDILASTFPNPDNPEDIRARSELERRGKYIESLESRFGSVHPDLVQLVKQCLHNVPTRRPSTEELLTRLQEMREVVQGEYGGFFKLDMVRVRLAKEVKDKGRMIIQQQERHEAELEVRDRRVEVLRAEVQNLNQEIAAKDHQNQQLQDEARAKDDQIHRLQDEARANDDQLGRLTRQLEELQTQIQRKTEEMVVKEKENRLQAEALKSKEAELSRLREILRPLQQTQQQKVQQGLLKLLQLTWRRGPDMPIGMSGYVQSAVVQGKVYVGGGYSGTFNSWHPVMEYEPSSEKWSRLLEYMTRDFAMTAINNQLVFVGGRQHDGTISKMMGVWEPDHKKWTDPYPDMPTPRYNCSAVAHNEWLVIAGGLAEGYQGLTSVQVLNTTTRAWQAGPTLPVAISAMKTAIVGDTLYLMGGYANRQYTDNVYSASLQMLILNTTIKRSQKIWKEIPGLHLKCSAPLSIKGSLLAVGGQDRDCKAVTAIHFYQPKTEDWVKVGDLKSPHYICTCALNSRGEVLVLGGTDSTYSHLARMDIASYH